MIYHRTQDACIPQTAQSLLAPMTGVLQVLMAAVLGGAVFPQDEIDTSLLSQGAKQCYFPYPLDCMPVSSYHTEVKAGLLPTGMIADLLLCLLYFLSTLVEEERRHPAQVGVLRLEAGRGRRGAFGCSGKYLRLLESPSLECLVVWSKFAQMYMQPEPLLSSLDKQNIAE